MSRKKRQQHRKKKAPKAPILAKAPPRPARQSAQAREVRLLQERLEEQQSIIAKLSRTEAALWQYWNLLDTLLNNSPDIFCLKDLAGRYKATSPSFCRFANSTENELRGKTDYEIFPKPIAVAFQRYDEAVIRSLQPYCWEESIPRLNGRHILHFSKTPYLAANHECIGVFSTIEDRTELRRAQEQNKIFQRSGQDSFWLVDLNGVILDVNQGYCDLTGYTRKELIGEKVHDIEVLAPPEELALQNNRIMELGWGHFRTLHRTKDNKIVEFEVSSNYLNIEGGRFYRFFHEITAHRSAQNIDVQEPAGNSEKIKPTRHCKVINMNDAVRQAITLMAESCPPGIRIEQDLENRLANIIANQPQMVQILVNLITNSIEAIERRGRILITTRNVDLTEELSGLFPQLKSGPYAYITVSDDGRGINPKLLDKIFEPFITTKFKGRGMGLASVYRNVTDHGGHITVKSREAQGATFSVYLPATQKQSDNASASIQIPTGTESILILDSESYALGDARRMLEKLAYRVLVARNEEEVLRILHNQGAAIHLLILDTRSIGGENKALLEHLKRIQPDLRIVLTGLQELDDSTQNLLDAGASSYIKKPFRIEVLAPKIRQSLDVF